jgi:predicted ribosomally synthesized peptide with nif11-like leader
VASCCPGIRIVGQRQRLELGFGAAPLSPTRQFPSSQSPVVNPSPSHTLEKRMSLQNARRFTQQVSRDSVLQAKVSEADSAEDVVSVADEAGFKFTEHDLEALASEWRESTELGVSSEQLEDSVSQGLKKKTIRKCLTEPETCGTPCCQIEPL